MVFIFLYFSVAQNDRNSVKQFPVSFSSVFLEIKKYETINPIRNTNMKIEKKDAKNAKTSARREIKYSCPALANS